MNEAIAVVLAAASGSFNGHIPACFELLGCTNDGSLTHPGCVLKCLDSRPGKVRPRIEIIAQHNADDPFIRREPLVAGEFADPGCLVAILDGIAIFAGVRGCGQMGGIFHISPSRTQLGGFDTSAVSI